MWLCGQRHALAALSPGKTRYLLYRGAGWAPGAVWTSAENLVFIIHCNIVYLTRTERNGCTLKQYNSNFIDLISS
jgi:hypothetical protein